MLKATQTTKSVFNKTMFMSYTISNTMARKIFSHEDAKQQRGNEKYFWVKNDGEKGSRFFLF